MGGDRIGANALVILSFGWVTSNINNSRGNFSSSSGSGLEQKAEETSLEGGTGEPPAFPPAQTFLTVHHSSVRGK